MATHSNNLAWKIPWTEEPGRLRSMGLQRVLEWGAITFSDVSHLATPKRYKETNMGSGHFTKGFPGGSDGKRLSTM